MTARFGDMSAVVSALSYNRPQAGDFFDATLGSSLALSTLAAAALGNMVGDTLGIMLGGTVEVMSMRMGLPDPELTFAQRKLSIVQGCKTAASIVGILIGDAPTPTHEHAQTARVPESSPRSMPTRGRGQRSGRDESGEWRVASGKSKVGGRLRHLFRRWMNDADRRCTSLGRCCTSSGLRYIRLGLSRRTQLLEGTEVVSPALADRCCTCLCRSWYLTLVERALIDDRGDSEPWCVSRPTAEGILVAQA